MEKTKKKKSEKLMVTPYNVSSGIKRVISSCRIKLLKAVHVNVLTSEVYYV